MLDKDLWWSAWRSRKYVWM